MKEIKLLAVDDLEDNLFLISNVFMSAGFSVDTATSGVLALDLLKVNRYDAIFIDYMMPEMNGLELANLVRNDDKNKDIPITFVTAVRKDDECVKDLEQFPDSHIIYKPIDAAQLTEHVLSIIGIETSSV